MLFCGSLKSISANSPSLATINLNSQSPLSPVNSSEGTPRPTTQPSPAFNVRREYDRTLHSNSFNDVLPKIHLFDPNQELQLVDINEDPRELLLSKVLNPNREFVDQALNHAKQNTLTKLVSTYFDHSENTANLCLVLYRSLHRATKLYKPINELLEHIPSNFQVISESHCNWAFNMFLEFDTSENPFPNPDSHNFHEMSGSFSQLKQQLDRRISRSRSRVRLFGGANAGPFCNVYLPGSFKKKELDNISQLDTAARCTFVLNGEIDTIGCLVARLYGAIENDKLFIRLGLDRGSSVYHVQEVVKLLHKNHLDFKQQLKVLEEHIRICFKTVNKARALLLNQINLGRSYSA